jgi:hypothetical protein
VCSGSSSSSDFSGGGFRGFSCRFQFQENSARSSIDCEFSRRPNAWIFNSDRILSARGTVADIFQKGQSDTIKFTGMPIAGNLVQVTFDNTHEPDDGFMINDISDEIPPEVSNRLKNHDDVRADDVQNTIDLALVGLITVTDRGIAKKQINAIVAAFDVAKASPPAFSISLQRTKKS